MPDRGKTVQVDMTEPVSPCDGQNLARDRAAGDDTNFFRARAFCDRASDPKFCVNHIRHRGTPTMTAKNLTKISFVFAALLALSACGNTIRGVGADTANAVDATQDAGNNVADAAE